MELSEYLGRIWHRKWIVLAVTLVVLAADIGIMYMLPRHYQASAMLEVGGVQSYLVNPGTPRDSGRQTLPSATQAITQTYLRILESPAVAEEAKRRAGNELAQNGGFDASDLGGAAPAAGQLEDVVYTGRAEGITGSGVDLIFIDVSADDPKIAKALADSLALVLVEQSRNLGGETASSFVREIENQYMDPIDERLQEIRVESEGLKVQTGGDVAARNVRIARLADEAEALEVARKQYTDIVARVRVNEALNVNNLKLLSPALFPTRREPPPYAKSAAVAATVGILLGIMGVLAIDRRRTDLETVY